MQYKKLTVCFLAFFNVFALSAFAGTSPKGVSGIINVPSAYISRPWKSSIGYFNARYGNSFAGNVSLPIDMEVAYSRLRLNNRPNCNIFSFKVPLLKESLLKPALAIGVEDLTDKFDRNYYLAMSKQAPLGFMLHLGARSGDKSGLFYGLEKQIRLKGSLERQDLFIPVLNLMLEYDGNNFNYGFYIRNKKGFRVDFAWHDDTFRTGFQFEF